MYFLGFQRYIVVVLLFSYSFLNAQNKSGEDLKRRLATEKGMEDSAKANIYNALTELYSRSEILTDLYNKSKDSAKYFNSQAFYYAHKAFDNKNIAAALYYRGIFNYFENDYDS